LNILHGLSKNTPISNVTKIRSVGVESRHVEANNCFSQFWESG